MSSNLLKIAIFGGACVLSVVLWARDRRRRRQEREKAGSVTTAKSRKLTR